MIKAQPDKTPDSMRIRRRTVEYPFATLKAWMAKTQFLIKEPLRF